MLIMDTKQVFHQLLKVFEGIGSKERSLTTHFQDNGLGLWSIGFGKLGAR